MTAFLRSLVNAVAQAVSAPAANTATVTSAGVDMLAYEGSALAVQQVGVVSGTNPTWDGKFQDSADNSTGWADIAGATFAQVTATGNIQAIAIDVQACKRYVRYVGTIGGTSTPTFNSGVSILGFKKQTG